MTGHCMSRQELTSAPQTCAQHAQSPNSNCASPPSSKLAISLQHGFPTSPTLSSHIPPTLADASDADLTPPTSSSGFSSQDRSTFGAQESSVHVFDSTDVDALFLLTSNPPANILNDAGTPLEHTAASKRTSSGQIKGSGISGADALQRKHESSVGHSRTPSLLSNGSSVAELSQQLRTRLSYAMVKVQNGWESNTLEELESLTSQNDSPRSSHTTTSFASRPQPSHSPRTTLTPTLERRGSSSVSIEVIPAPADGALNDHRPELGRNQPHRIGNGLQRRALAPPADIVSGTRRRPHHANAPPNGYRPVSSQRPTGLKQRTASQNAAMEADAVETLLFMASPGNSGHNPPRIGGKTSSARMSAPNSSQTSPLKSSFSGQELNLSPRRRVAFTGLSESRPQNVGLPVQVDIDRMIDEMDDASTDSDLECLNNTIAPQLGVEHAVPI